MNWLDIAILAVVAIVTFIGARAGIIKSVLSLVGLVVGVILAGRYYALLAKQLTFIPQENIAQVVAFAILLVMVMVIAGLLGVLLTRLISAVRLGWVNHLGGAIFGLALGAMLCAVLLALWGKFWGGNEIIKESSLARILLDRFPAVLALLPDEFNAIRSLFY
jgi:membrane protein required for colicin V production